MSASTAMPRPIHPTGEEDYAVAWRWIERERARVLLRTRRDALRREQSKDDLLAVGDLLGM